MSPLPNVTVRCFHSDGATEVQLTQSCELYFRSVAYAAFVMAEMRLGTTLLPKEPSSHTPPPSKVQPAPEAQHKPCRRCLVIRFFRKRMVLSGFCRLGTILDARVDVEEVYMQMERSSMEHESSQAGIFLVSLWGHCSRHSAFQETTLSQIRLLIPGTSAECSGLRS